MRYLVFNFRVLFDKSNYYKKKLIKKGHNMMYYVYKCIKINVAINSSKEDKQIYKKYKY